MSSLPSAPDYFSNHVRARRFPWSIYHAPMEQSLARFADQARIEAKHPLQILVLGCGFFHEAALLPSDSQCTVVDLDPRVIETVKTLPDPFIRSRVVRAQAVDEKFTPDQLGQEFDLIYAKEVIEHLPNPPEYLRKTWGALRVGGKIWLSTPNYGEPWLPLIENTFLEIVARISGFTRKGIHPSPFSSKSLRETLVGAGFKDVQTSTVSMRLGLVGTGTRR